MAISVDGELEKLMKLVGDPGKTPKNDVFCEDCGKPEQSGVLCVGKEYRNVTAQMLHRNGWLKEEYR
jgi:hypothetical protein